jgi:hypothetical protein
VKHYLEYRKASYEIVMIAESRCNICLDEDVEYFVVDTLARYMEEPNIPTDAIAIKMLEATSQKGDKKKKQLQQIAEECLLIDGLELNSRRWPSKSYFRDMGQLALEHRAWIERPPELFYEKVAMQFDLLSKVIHAVRM